MGWDAYAMNRGKHIRVKWGDYSNPYIISKRLREAFKDARRRVLRHCHVDGMLDIGGLDLSGCGIILQIMTDLDAWRIKDWTVKEVKQAWKIWQSREKSGERKLHNPTYYWSAREFLRVCAEQNLSIHFSW